MILFYGRTCQITKSLFSLEFYGAFYKGFDHKILQLVVLITQDASLTVNGFAALAICGSSREKLYQELGFESLRVIQDAMFLL